MGTRCEVVVERVNPKHVVLSEDQLQMLKTALDLYFVNKDSRCSEAMYGDIRSELHRAILAHKKGAK